MRTKLIALIAVLFIAVSSFAQAQIKSSPFKHLPIPQRSELLKAQLITAKNTVTAWRFSLPFAGFDIKTQQISTGLAYGWSKLHFVDSTQKYYTDLSIFGTILINGNTAPTPFNFTSVGLGIGILNGLINIIPCYNIGNTTDKFSFKVSFGLTLK